MESLCRSPLGSNSNVVSMRRRCLVEVDKPGLLVVMEDMVDEVKVMSVRVPKKAYGHIRKIGSSGVSLKRSCKMQFRRVDIL